MEQLTDKANNYAETKTFEFLKEVFAKVYIDGYRDGYKDKEAELYVNMCDSTEYADLGLPSGTLWSADYLKEKGKFVYMPYNEAANYNIPTESQWNELFEICEYQVSYNQYGDVYSITFIGPNGNTVRFSSCGYKKVNKNVDKNLYGAGHVYFWITDDEETYEKKTIHIGLKKDNDIRKTHIGIDSIFSGFQLPVRLVQSH